MDCWSCSGDNPLSHCPPRNSSRYSFVVFMRTLLSFCVFVSFPKGKRVVLRVLADGEVTHLRYGAFRHADFAAEFLDLVHELIHRRHAHVVGDALLTGIL